MQGIVSGGRSPQPGFYTYVVFPDSGVIRTVGPSVFPDSQHEKSSFETYNLLFGIVSESEMVLKYIPDNS